MSIINEYGEVVKEWGFTQSCHLGNVDEVEVNGQYFFFEGVTCYQTFADPHDEYPHSLRAEWDNVQWINRELDYALTVPACFIDSAPMTDHRQPSAVSWGALMERALIERAEEKGIWS